MGGYFWLKLDIKLNANSPNLINVSSVIYKSSPWMALLRRGSISNKTALSFWVIISFRNKRSAIDLILGWFGKGISFLTSKFLKLFSSSTLNSLNACSGDSSICERRLSNSGLVDFSIESIQISCAFSSTFSSCSLNSSFVHPGNSILLNKGSNQGIIDIAIKVTVMASIFISGQITWDMATARPTTVITILMVVFLLIHHILLGYTSNQ